MSIDVLHEKIRKLKTPVIVDFSVNSDIIPESLKHDGKITPEGYAKFCGDLLQALKGIVPGVRFPFSAFALLGAEGLSELSKLLKTASELGFYVLVDAPEIMTPWAAERTAEAFFGEESLYPCDGLLISPYIGSDAVKPFLPYCKDQQKDLFLIARTPNKSAVELQDLMTGTRLVHRAAADLAARHGETILGKCGYSRVGAMLGVTAVGTVRDLRKQYSRLFLLLDGLDYPSGKFTHCPGAFDRFGFGAVVSVGSSVTGAWRESDSDGADYIQQALEAVERIKRNLARYITVL